MVERERKSWGGDGRGGMYKERVRLKKSGDMWREWVNECMCVGEREGGREGGGERRER